MILEELEPKSMRSTIPILDYVPVGFRFRPTDEELVSHYLKHKLQGDKFIVEIIPDIDLCKVEPWDVPGFSVIKSGDPEWFFFSPRDYKYSSSKRSNRTTKHGFWKATGQDRKIRIRGTTNVIGTKKTLVFYEGRVPSGCKTNWVIHEYHATTLDDIQRTFVLCRLMKKANRKTEGEPCSSLMASSDYENHETAERIPNVETRPIVNTGIEEQTSFPNSPFPNAYSPNEITSMYVPFETTEEEEDANNFANSLLVDDENVVISEERRHAFVNSFTQSESFRRVYYENSDTDAEVVF